MTYATMALQGIGTAMGVFGSLYKGEVDSYNARVESEARARQAEAQAEADTFNAKVYRQVAKSEEDQAAAQATDYRRVNRAQLAQLRARQAASGLAMSGSPLMINEAAFQEIEFSTNRIAYAGQLMRTRYENQASLFDISAKRNIATADFARKTGAISAENIKTGSIINAITSGLGGTNQMLKGYTPLATRVSSGGSSSSSPFYISSGTGWF